MHPQKVTNDKMGKYLTLSNSKELFRLPIDNIMYVAGDGDYSQIMMADGKDRTVTCQLGRMEEMMQKQLDQDGRHLVRIGKSLIVNMNFITYINPAKKLIVLSDCRGLEFKQSASKEALTDLKLYLESQAS